MNLKNTVHLTADFSDDADGRLELGFESQSDSEIRGVRATRFSSLPICEHPRHLRFQLQFPG